MQDGIYVQNKYLRFFLSAKIRAITRENMLNFISHQGKKCEVKPQGHPTAHLWSVKM